MSVRVLCKTKWVSLMAMKTDMTGDNEYIYSHENRCDGKIVSILPYRYKTRMGIISPHEKYGIEYLLRKEVTPPWGKPPKQFISSITGGVENGDTIGTAVHEIAEEAGYEVDRKDLKFLDISYGSKSSDTVYYLYTVDLSGKEKTLKAKGDGSILETMAECFWSDTIENAVDPLVYVSYYKIQKMLKK